MMSTSSDLLVRVDGALRRATQLGRHAIELADHDGHVIVRGRVATFFQKQVAQEVIRRVDGVQGIDNQLIVNWPAAGRT